MRPEPVSVKICGLTTTQSVEAAITHGASYLGCVHYPASPRHCTLETVEKLFKPVDSTIGKVVVLVDADDALITEVTEKTTATHLQLHGNESPARVVEIRQRTGLHIIKSLTVRSADDIAAAGAYTNVTDMLLFDAKPPRGLPSTLPGGNGITFDWTLLKQHRIQLPWFLAGGICHENVEEALRISGARFIDISSSLESEPGVKDNNAIAGFLNHVHHLSNQIP